MAAEITDEIQSALRRGKSRSETAGEQLPGAGRSNDLKDLALDNPSLGMPITAGHSAIRAEIEYAVSNELAMTIGDVLIRRTHVAFETADHGRLAAETVADEMADLFSWSKKEKSDQLRRYSEESDRIFGAAPTD
jgi:glycerol-3-phosphate dehydrogenase